MYPETHIVVHIDWVVVSVSENGASGRELSVAGEVVNST